MNQSRAVHRMRADRAVKANRRYHSEMEIILGSRSPRRLTLLQSAGLAVEVRPSHIDETPFPDESVHTMVKRLSREKALACHAPAGSPIIAADTLVAIGKHVLGQPRDLKHAKNMLQQLSGSEHQVITGICVRLGERLEQQHVETRVRFRDIAENEIDIYLAHNDVLDKAGSYAVQGGAASFIESIDGPLDNVIGLPVRTTLSMLSEICR
ncbi:MAG: Maf family protein [Mariprofundus sp.]